MEGWVKLHRKIATWQWATSACHMTTFMQLLLRANHKTTKWRMETIQPGQLLTGRKQLMDWTGLSEKQIRKCLDDLELTGEISRKRAAKYSIITISNWETYQSEDQQRASKGPAEGQQRATSKNANNAKNEKNVRTNTLTTSPLASLFADSDLVQSWLLTGTELAQQTLLTSYPADVLRSEILKAYIWQSENSKRKAGSFLVTWMERSNTRSGAHNRSNSAFKSKTNGVAPTPKNPTGNPYIQQALDEGIIA